MEGCINISFDYKETFRKIVKHMVEDHGYKIFNFMGGLPGNSFSEERLNVFKQVLEENQIPFDERRVYYGYFWEVPTRAALQKMMADGLPMPEAIICANDTMALTVCSFLQEHGYRVPEDIAVSGFDGLEAEKYNKPRLLTGVYDNTELVRTIFHLIEDGIPEEEQELQVSAYQFQIGGSCGCKGLETLQGSDKIIELRTEMLEQLEYQMQLGQMVAKQGSEENKGGSIKAVTGYMKQLKFHDCWFCSNEIIEREAFFGEVLEQEIRPSKAITEEETMKVLHFGYENNRIEMRTDPDILLRDLIPDFKTVLRERDFLLVVAIPMQENAAGYMAVSFDAEAFWYTAYAGFILHFRFLLELQRSQRKQMQMYVQDSLTGLYSRNGFYEKMKSLMELTVDMELAVVSIDMDRFKQINDTYGHAEGDEALKTFAGILKESTKHELVARIGGDEFLVVLAGKNLEERTKQIVDSVKEKTERYNQTGKTPYQICFSAGTFTAPLKGHGLDYFLREADKLMYFQKNRKKETENR